MGEIKRIREIKNLKKPKTTSNTMRKKKTAEPKIPMKQKYFINELPKR